MKPKKSHLNPFEEWTFDELVDYHAGAILKELIAGTLKSGVWIAMDQAIRWHREQMKKEKQ